MSKIATKRSILGSFNVYAFYHLEQNHFMTRYRDVKCSDQAHDFDRNAAATVTWRYWPYSLNNTSMARCSMTSIYICSLCAYRRIREACSTPLEATRYLFAATHKRPVVLGRHTPSSQVFIAMPLQSDRVTNKLITEWTLSLYEKVI